MSHPIVELQGRLMAAFAGDAALVSLIGADGVMDAVPQGRSPPYAVMVRHDLVSRDGDVAPGWEHRVVLQVWTDQASRKSVLAIIERLQAVALGAALAGGGIRVTHRRHERTETAVDPDTGWARGALAMRFWTEPG
jgi:hypothetical protein